MSIAALFTIAKTCKQPRCPSTGRIKKMWYIDMVEYYPTSKKNETMPFAPTWMDLQIVTRSEVSQTEKEKHCMIALSCRILKNNTNELIYKLETDSQAWRMKLRLSWGKGLGKFREFEIDM